MRLEPMRWWHVAQVMPLEEQLFAPDCWSAELFWSELAQGDSRSFVVAVEGDRVVGYAGLATVQDEGSVQTIAVDPGEQGKGIGAALLDELLAEADRRGARRVGLEVREGNPAERLYEARGFRRVGVRRGYYQPSGGDAVIMERRA